MPEIAVGPYVLKVVWARPGGLAEGTSLEEALASPTIRLGKALQGQAKDNVRLELLRELCHAYMRLSGLASGRGEKQERLLCDQFAWLYGMIEGQVEAVVDELVAQARGNAERGRG